MSKKLLLVILLASMANVNIHCTDLERIKLELERIKLDLKRDIKLLGFELKGARGPDPLSILLGMGIGYLVTVAVICICEEYNKKYNKQNNNKKNAIEIKSDGAVEVIIS